MKQPSNATNCMARCTPSSASPAIRRGGSGGMVIHDSPPEWKLLGLIGKRIDLASATLPDGLDPGSESDRSR